MAEEKPPLTVAKLIEILQTHDPNAVVYFSCVDDYYSGTITADDIRTDGPMLVIEAG